MARIAIYNEFVHEKIENCVKEIYPNGIHKVLGDFLKKDGHEVFFATLEDHVEVLTPEFLKSIDVLIWWGHMRHNEVSDEVVEHIKYAVNCGMGFIALHSAHHSKPFRALMGTTCNLSWSENRFERLWVVDPSHPIVRGIERYFELPAEEIYCEPFGVPEPENLLLIGWYSSGEVFRSGCTYKRGYGKVFYFQPGHETYPTYYDENVQKIIKNAVNWAVPAYRADIDCPYVEPLG